MATVVADDNFKCILLNENNKIPIPNADSVHWRMYEALGGDD